MKRLKLPYQLGSGVFGIHFPNVLDGVLGYILGLPIGKRIVRKVQLHKVTSAKKVLFGTCRYGYDSLSE